MRRVSLTPFRTYASTPSTFKILVKKFAIYFDYTKKNNIFALKFDTYDKLWDIIRIISWMLSNII